MVIDDLITIVIHIRIRLTLVDWNFVSQMHTKNLLGNFMEFIREL